MSDTGGVSRHFTQHGSPPSGGDSLDVYREEREVLKELLAHWDLTRKDEPVPEGESAAPEKWDNGTVGKLVLEHGATFFGCVQDLGGALSRAGRHDMEHSLSQLAESARPPLGEMAKLSRGVSPMSLAGDSEWVEAFSALRAALQPALLDESVSAAAIEEALGQERQTLRSAKYIRKHAPANPTAPGWFSKVPFLMRVQAAYDRSRGFPWAESAPLASSKIAKHYDREAS